ncbi:FMN-linked oxidoreductase [Dendrothele bispora CBS 962.96]|uniref:FMN-linked oxidoreductase n=1 Tax=Dendrothele bispora (strain CBS 962.96) TaxID=1314807 RepID=A0A4S8MLN9_DENBC|nr:FMN-linked oxidoreductase [Dendrothele bispora CBS 962.96]
MECYAQLLIPQRTGGKLSVAKTLGSPCRSEIFFPDAWAPGIWSSEHVEAWKKIVDAVHDQGCHIYCQVCVFGRVAHPNAPEQIASGEPVYGPSAIRARGGKFRWIPGSPSHATPTPLDNPRKIVAQFKDAAVRAKEAGFDGVELHAVSGYLINQFLDSTSNHRTDEWGGSIENRCRFGLEVVEALVDVWGADRVGIRVTPSGGYNDMGMPLDETIVTYEYFLTETDKFGLAYVNLIRYIELTDPVIDGQRRGTAHDIIATYSPMIKNSTILSNGAFTPEEAASFVSDGKVAGVFFGIPWISHPDLAKRIQYGKLLDQKPDPHYFWSRRFGFKSSGERLYRLSTCQLRIDRLNCKRVTAKQ